MTAGNVPLVPLVIGTLIDGNVISNEANLGSALAVGMIFIAVITMSGYLLAQKYASRWRTK
jgi:putative spermidine/putrescine transport system permease protein